MSQSAVVQDFFHEYTNTLSVTGRHPGIFMS